MWRKKHTSVASRTEVSRKGGIFRHFSRRPARSATPNNSGMHERVFINEHWMKSTWSLRHIQLFDRCFEETPALLHACKDKTSSNKIIQKLSRYSKHCQAQHNLTRLRDLGDGGDGSKSHIVTLAYLLMLKYETADGCWAVVEQVKDRIDRCQSAQKQAYVLVIQHGAQALQFSTPEKKSISTDWDRMIPTSGKNISFVRDARVESPADIMIERELDDSARATYKDALNNIQLMVEDFLDGHKENAFKSALHEPARFYFHACGNNHHRDHVNVHGINGWLCLVRGWFGCHLPMIPMKDDIDTFKGCADVWSGLSDDAWSLFSDEANFGKNFEGVKGLKKAMVTDINHAEYAAGKGFIGRNAGDMEKAAKRRDSRYLKYANKFAFFFRKEFLVKKMFEVLNAEVKPEYVGFRKGCDGLYPLFKEHNDFSEESLLECLYDDSLTRLDVDRAAAFFWFCGVCKEATAQVTREEDNRKTAPALTGSQENDLTCPICFEEKDSLVQIPHWEAKGDISGHKMCEDCTKAYAKNECPFCHEISLKENILAVIRGFISDLKDRKKSGDPNDLAALLETWQFFEMEYGSNPKIIHRVAKLVVQDCEFKALLQDGVESEAGWMRDAAGTIFRLHSLSVEGVLDILDDEHRLLKECYRTIREIVRTREHDSGHYYGALYCQAIVPYMCALQSGQDTTQLEAIVRDIGHLVVGVFKKLRRSRPQLKTEIPERIVPEYMPIVTANVWGGERNDPVWKTFYAS